MAEEAGLWWTRYLGRDNKCSRKINISKNVLVLVLVILFNIFYPETKLRDSVGFAKWPRLAVMQNSYVGNVYHQDLISGGNPKVCLVWVFIICN